MILVVEDETDVREELVEMLELRSFAVSGAACVALALESLKQGSSHVTLLTDLRLRDGSGLDLVRAIRADPDLRAKVNTIILMTGHTDLTEQIEHETKKKDLHVLFKPVDLDLLLSLLTQDGRG